jgi:predicted DCC family thiol-disulfide oxidoreductase YuxK/DNA polymerase III epsilon subunit-like protein
MTGRSNDGEPIVVLDCETTSANPLEAELVEIAIVDGLEDTSDRWVQRVRPTVRIPEDATRVHGIEPADVADSPVFREVGEEIRRRLEAAKVIIGYNVGYDLAVLEAEFRRHGLPPLDLTRSWIVDPYRIWRARERRTLSHAHERFVGSSFDGAHGASADAAATARVLKGMLTAFRLDGSSWRELAALSAVRVDGSARPGSPAPPIILFDGECRLCSAWVGVVRRWDTQRRFRFAPLQSTAAGAILEGRPGALAGRDSVVLADGERVFTESEAVLRVLEGLGGVWGISRAARLVPRPIRDLVYRWVARHRVRWFGRTGQERGPG